MSLRGKHYSSKKNITQCRFVHHNSHKELSGAKSESPPYVSGDLKSYVFLYDTIYRVFLEKSSILVLWGNVRFMCIDTTKHI